MAVRASVGLMTMLPPLSKGTCWLTMFSSCRSRPKLLKMGILPV